MNRFLFPLLFLVFIYFLVNSVILLFQGEQWAALCCITIAIGAPFAIMRFETTQISGPILIFFSVMSVFSDYNEKTNDPKHKYHEYVIATFEDGYYGEHENKVTMACATQDNVNNLKMVFNIFKAIYYDVLMSAVDFILVNSAEAEKIIV